MSKATTKFAIAFAFKELLLEKSIDKITINDITEKCGINRQTFYYHFHDIYELIEWICETDADHVLKQNKTYDTWQKVLFIFGFVGWLRGGRGYYGVMGGGGGRKEDPKQIIERLNALIQGSFAHALNNAKLNKS